MRIARGEQSELWATRAYVAAHKRDHETAEHDIRRAIDLERMDPEYLFSRGRYRLKSGRFGEAVGDFSRTIELCEHRGSDYYREAVYSLRAEAHLALGMTDLARADCEHVREGEVWWMGGIRSKKDILEACRRKDSAAS